MIFVVGSGPAGISAAVRLVRAGLEVTLLDGGKTLEAPIRAKLQTLSKESKHQWNREFISSFSASLQSDAKGLQKKLCYGSDFAYAEVEGFIPYQASNIGQFSPSLAQGGFSNVWGTAVLPFMAKEIASWPISIEDLAPSYESVLGFMPLSGARDKLEEFFPLHISDPQRLQPSNQIKRVFAYSEKSHKTLTREGFHLGMPRLAVHGNRCVYCGLCLFGCPHTLLYSTQETLAQLQTEKNFHYRPNVVVTKLIEHSGKVEIEALERVTRSPLQFSGNAVFLAAGILPTAKIIFDSFPNISRERDLLVSEYFLLPLLLSGKALGVKSEELHSLSQAFLECMNESVSRHSVHMQLYTFSELYETALKRMLRPLGPLRGAILPALLPRLLAMQGYLHSDESSRIQLRYNGKELHMLGVRNKNSRRIIRSLARRLFSLRRELGFTALVPALNIGLPGEGRHVGGTFPMREQPDSGETDPSGRLARTENIFIADASVFPSVPASTITFTAMANADRIAKLYSTTQGK